MKILLFFSSELVCRVKYCNTLPDIPFDPKFLSYPFESTRFVNYKPTSLERNYKYELQTEHDMGITVDLVLPDAYAYAGDQEDVLLDPKDEKLLEEDYGIATDRKRSKQHAKELSWMRRPDYISTEQTRYQPTTIEKIESRVGYAVRKKMGDEHNTFMDRDAQIGKIEKTFEDSKLEITEHHSKKGVVPVSILPIVPDDDMWKFPCAQVIFDSDPAPYGFSANTQNEMMAQAMIRGVMDESGEQFVAYFLPTEETMEKRATDLTMERDYDDEQEYEYKMAREYNWNVKSKANKGYEENYFVVQREDGLYYNELETR
jgi:RNA polymerase II-associated factor 1